MDRSQFILAKDCNDVNQNVRQTCCNSFMLAIFDHDIAGCEKWWFRPEGQYYANVFQQNMKDCLSFKQNGKCCIANYIQNQANAENDAKEKLEKLKKAAEQGDADAQYELGFAYKDGRGVPQDYDKAFDLINEAAENGNEKAKNYMQKMKEEGKKYKRYKRMRLVAPILMLLSIIMTFIGYAIGGDTVGGSTIMVLIIMLIPFLFLYFSQKIILRIIFLIGSIALSTLFISIPFSAEDVKELVAFIFFIAFYLLSCIISMIFPRRD